MAGVAALVVVLGFAALVVLDIVNLGGGSAPRTSAVAAAGAGQGEDPFAYSDERRQEFEERAAAGLAHVLYARSPGGVIASARRTIRFRTEIDRVASDSGVDPGLMEAMVFLESAGRPQVIAGDDPAAAAGLGQILAETGSNLLGMRVDLARSRKLTAEISAAERQAARIPDRIAKLRKRVADAKPAKARRLKRRVKRLDRTESRLPARERRLRAERARIDERFDPEAALAGMARYLSIAEQRFGRADLAVESYHMGIGNLEGVIRAYAGSGGDGPVADVVDRERISYAKLFFDSSPLGHQAAWRLLAGFGDDSSTYLWRVLAAREILRLYRTDRDRLNRLIELQGAKATAEEVFHPEDRTGSFADPAELASAYDDGTLVEIPDDPGLAFRVGPQLGKLASDVGARRRLYAGLRPEALATLIYMAARVRAISGHPHERLIVTSAVRDRAYQDRLVAANPEATPNYSLHTTGFSFDILRRYRSAAEAAAFQFVLDRLRALAVIDYAVEPSSIHVTVSDRASALLELG